MLIEVACSHTRWVRGNLLRGSPSERERRWWQVTESSSKHKDGRLQSWKSGSLEQGLSKIVIRVCVGPAGCHLEPSMFVGWLRINLTRGSINMSATLPSRLLSPCLSKRANAGPTDALCFAEQAPRSRGSLHTSGLSICNPRKRSGFPFERGRLQASGVQGVGGRAQAC